MDRDNIPALVNPGPSKPVIYGFQIRLVDGLGITITKQLMERGVFNVRGRDTTLYACTLRVVPPPESGGWLTPGPDPIEAVEVTLFIVPEQVADIRVSLDREHKLVVYANPAKILRTRFEQR